MSRVPPDAVGLNPAWRAALVHTIFSTGWAEGTPVDVIDGLVGQVRQNMTTLRALAPDSGAYFNEVGGTAVAALRDADGSADYDAGQGSLVEPDPLQAFFGDHHTELRAIKAIYDPLDMFVVAEGIGSDEWDANLVCRITSSSHGSR